MLLNPNHLQRRYPDRRSAEIMAATVDFFESRGKARLKSDDHEEYGTPTFWSTSAGSGSSPRC